MTTDQSVSTAEPTGGESPILRVRWVLESYTPIDRVFQPRPGETGGPRTQRRIQFKFTSVDVLESEEPYFMPTAEVFITYANPSQSRGSNRWEAFAASTRRIFGKRPDNLDQLVGKEQEWAQLPAPVRSRRGAEDMVPDENGVMPEEWFDAQIPCWQVVSVEGVAALGSAPTGDLYSYAITLMDGKTAEQFKQIAMSDQKILRVAELTEEISQNQIIGKLLAVGSITRDPDGIIHKV